MRDTKSQVQESQEITRSILPKCVHTNTHMHVDIIFKQCKTKDKEHIEQIS